MKCSMRLLIIFIFLVLLAFLDEQARAGSSDAELHSKADFLQSYNPPAEIYVRLWHLRQDGSRDPFPSYTECSSGDNYYGCAASGSGQFYPYDTNPALVSMENDYLLDVVPREESPFDYHPLAEAAQAVTSRSFAYYWNNAGYNLWNCSDSYNGQVFVPYTFEYWLGPNYPDNPNTPCQSGNLNDAQRIVCNAVAPRHYLTENHYSDAPAKTEFSSDAFGWTKAGDQAYLQSVQDPISTACDANDFGHGIGMSQEGASRWARGHECSKPGATPAPGNQPGETWSVRWNRVEQILFHYYTGVHLRETGGAALSPSYRWNPLSISTSGDYCPPIMRHGYNCTFTVEVQNTGIWGWNCDTYTHFSLGVWWEEAGTQTMAPSAPESPTVSVCGLEKGDSYSYTLDVEPLPGWGSGAYTLHFDILWEDGPDTYWFSQFGWSSYEVSVCVDGECPYFLPLTMKE